MSGEAFKRLGEEISSKDHSQHGRAKMRSIRGFHPESREEIFHQKESKKKKKKKKRKLRKLMCK